MTRLTRIQLTALLVRSCAVFAAWCVGLFVFHGWLHDMASSILLVFFMLFSLDAPWAKFLRERGWSPYLVLAFRGLLASVMVALWAMAPARHPLWNPPPWSGHMVLSAALITGLVLGFEILHYGLEWHLRKRMVA